MRNVANIDGDVDPISPVGSAATHARRRKNHPGGAPAGPVIPLLGGVHLHLGGIQVRVGDFLLDEKFLVFAVGCLVADVDEILLGHSVEVVNSLWRSLRSTL